MLVKILGLMDFGAAIMLILLKWEIGMVIGWIFAIYLLVKSIIFLYDIASLVDLVTAVFFLLAVTGNYFFFTWIFSLWLLQKAFFSLTA